MVSVQPLDWHLHTPRQQLRMSPGPQASSSSHPVAFLPSHNCCCPCIQHIWFPSKCLATTAIVFHTRLYKLMLHLHPTQAFDVPAICLAAMMTALHIRLIAMKLILPAWLSSLMHTGFSGLAHQACLAVVIALHIRLVASQEHMRPLLQQMHSRPLVAGPDCYCYCYCYCMLGPMPQVPL